MLSLPPSGLYHSSVGVWNELQTAGVSQQVQRMQQPNGDVTVLLCLWEATLALV